MNMPLVRDSAMSAITRYYRQLDFCKFHTKDTKVKSNSKIS